MQLWETALLHAMARELTGCKQMQCKKTCIHDML